MLYNKEFLFTDFRGHDVRVALYRVLDSLCLCVCVCVCVCFFWGGATIGNTLAAILVFCFVQLYMQ